MEIIKKHTDSIKKILIILIYRLSLDLIYITIISKFYRYGNFILNVEGYKYVFSIIITCIAAIPIYNLINLNKPSNVIVTLFNLMYFIPGTTMYGLKGFSDGYFLYFIIYWYLLLFLQCKIKLKISKETILKNKIKDYRYVIAVVLFFTIAAIVISGVYNGFKLNFSLSNVYELREAAKETDIPTALQYIRTWATKIIPIGLAITLLKKKYKLSILLIIAQLLLFSFDGMKSSLFILIFVILAYFLLNKKSYSKILPTFTILGMGLNMIGVIFNKCPILMSYIHRRVMFLPSLLSNYYYEFFSVNEKLLLRQSVLGKFGFSNPYALDVGYLISDVFFNKVTMNSCNGLLGDAFSNFGWCSLLFYPLMLVLVLKILDFTTENINMKIVFVVCVELFIAFTNGSFFTAVLTGGTLVIMLLFMLFPKDDSVDSETDLYTKLEPKFIEKYHELKKYFKKNL